MPKYREFNEDADDIEDIEFPFHKRSMTIEERDEFFEKHCSVEPSRKALDNIEHTLRAGRITIEERDEILRESKETLEKDEIGSETKFEEVMDDIAREVSSNIESKNDVENERKELDIVKVHRLYFDEGLSMKDTAKYFGYKSAHVIRQIFEEQDWRARQQKFSLSDTDLKTLHRLYYEEKKPLLDIGKYFGLKTSNPISRIIKEQGWKLRSGSHVRKDLSPKEIHSFYFEKKMSFEKIANHLGLQSSSPVYNLFKEQRWAARPVTLRRTNINIEEVYSLYFEKKLSMTSIGKQLGCSQNLIRRIFKEEEWEARPSGGRKTELDPLKIYTLYYEEMQTQREIAEQFGLKSAGPIRRLFKEMGWTPRRVYESEEDQRIAEIKRRRNEHKRVVKLREQLFGLECKICGHEKIEIHKKDGEKHPHQLLWSIKGLESLKVNEWVALCHYCHRAVHALMERTDMQYDEIESSLKKLITKK